jgi:release factor glutamine methyltransferase
MPLPALAVAEGNAPHWDWAWRARFLLRDWSQRLGRGLGTFDLILANPPYVEDDAPLDAPCATMNLPARCSPGPRGWTITAC